MYQLFRITIFNFTLFITYTTISAQPFSQTIRGTVIDQDGKSPVSGANIMIIDTNTPKNTTSDEKGEFKLTNIALGRASLQVTMMGYEPKQVPNILVGSGKEVILQIEMKELVHTLNEVNIDSRKKGEVRNEMVISSARSFSVEETKRYAGAFQDPSRMVSAFAGVSSDPTGNNSIIVRGNSPKGILWRMEGVEIPNPNHFANEGATGGPINALNSELLANSDFYTGAFSPEYGDALSGVFDMKMRNGNNEKREYSVGLGVLGTDITMEGPLKKDYRGSYLFNYRYSSLAMLNDAGLVNFAGVPKYQDAAFKINLPSKNLGTLSLFGIGGLSNIYQTLPDSNQKVMLRADYGAKLGVVGINHMLPITQNSFIKLTVAVSNNGSKINQEQLDSMDVFKYNGEGNWEKSSVRTALMYSVKLNSQNRIIIGSKYTRHAYNLYDKRFNTDHNRWEKQLDINKNVNSYQSYVSWKYLPNDNWTIVGGIHAINYSFNNKINFEPRLSSRWQITTNQSFNIGYGMHSKSESMAAYYTTLTDPSGNTTTPNTHMELSKAQHFVVGYEYRIAPNVNTKIEVYHQSLNNIPVENIDTSSFSILNSEEGYINNALVNKGKGYNYGLEYTLEKYFDHNYYFLVTGSLYDSKYKALDGVYRNTKYNGNYAFNFLIGKEFIVRNGGRANTLGINTKFYYSGGQRYIPVNLSESKIKGYTVFDNTHAWENKLDNILQINVSLTYRINLTKTSHEFVLDISNITNANGRIYEYYDKYTNKLEYQRQLSLLPNIMYRILF